MDRVFFIHVADSQFQCSEVCLFLAWFPYFIKNYMVVTSSYL